jgi:hypothetical protein
MSNFTSMVLASAAFSLINSFCIELSDEKERDNPCDCTISNISPCHFRNFLQHLICIMDLVKIVFYKLYLEKNMKRVNLGKINKSLFPCHSPCITLTRFLVTHWICYDKCCSLRSYNRKDTRIRILLKSLLSSSS